MDAHNLERKRAVEELARSKEFIETIYNNVRDSISVIDTKSHKIIGVNRAFLNDLGLREDEVIGNKCYTVTHHRTKPCEPPDDICPLIETLKTGGYSTAEHIHLTKDGKEILFEVSTTPIRNEEGEIHQVVHVAKDITDRKRTEEILRERAKIFESINDGIILYGVDGRVIQANESWYRMMGIDEKVEGKHFSELPSSENQDPAEIEKYKPLFEECLKKDITNSVDLKINTIDGREIFVSGTSSMIRDLEGNPKRIILVFRDITEQKAAEEEIKRSLREKEILLKEIHHRVKNNLQIISSLLSLQQSYIKDEETRQLFEENQNRVRSMALIHEKLYQTEDLHKIEYGAYIKTMADDLIRTSTELNTSNIKIDVQTDEIFLDIDQAIPMGLILTELVTNCIKHAFPDRRKGLIRIELKEEKTGQIIFKVSDNGVGIPKNVDFHNSNTLGLRLIRSLTEQLDGNIKIEGTQGTSIKLTVPIRNR